MKSARKSVARLIVLKNSDPISAEAEAIQGRIRQRAFELSQTRSHDAREAYDWIMAESEIISIPPVELIEKETTLELKFAVAGVNPDAINVMVTADQLLIKAESSHAHESDIGTVHLCDFKSATVFRSVHLPQPIDVNSVKVDFAEGMLLVTASKEGAEPTRPKRAAPARKASPKKSRTKTP